VSDRSGAADGPDDGGVCVARVGGEHGEHVQVSHAGAGERGVRVELAAAAQGTAAAQTAAEAESWAA